jgi:hypothetical protein
VNKYLFVVYGPPAESEAERGAGMAAMAGWYKALGSALTDPGAPFTGVKTVSQSGVENGGIGPNATGYTFVQARSLDAAAELAKGCPLLQHGRRIAVFETFSPGS